MPLINCKVGLSLTQGEKWILSGNSAGTAARFKITDAKLSVPVVTLLTENNIKLTKQLNDGFKGSVYWNKYRMIPNNKKEPPNNGTRYIREFLDANYQEAKVKYYLFLLMIMKLTMIILTQLAELELILIKSIFFQE